MKYFCLLGRTLSLVVPSVIIAAIFCAFLLGTIATAHAAGLKTPGIFDGLRAEVLYDMKGQLSKGEESLIKDRRIDIAMNSIKCLKW